MIARRALGRLRPTTRGRRKVAQGTVLALLAGTLVALAVTHDGSPIRDVELNDGSVWVTNNSRGLAARLNAQVQELDLSVVTSSTSDTVYQQGSSVQLFDDGGSDEGAGRSLTLVDVVSGTTRPIPFNGRYVSAVGGNTVAVMDRDTGKVWLRHADRLQAFDASAPADAVVAERSPVAVTLTGTALVGDRTEGTVTSWRFDDLGQPVEVGVVDFGTELLDDVTLSAVGETPVLLQAGTLYRPGTEGLEVPGEGARLQAVGPEDSAVHVATTTGLWRGDLADGALEEIGPDGIDADAAEPVVVGPCVHAAWNQSGSDNYTRVCDDVTTSGEVVGLTSASQLVFRTNRDVVVLNDAANGTSWLVQEPGLTRVDDWDSVDPNASDPQVAQADDRAQRSDRNQPPTAVDDTFGARPGSTVVLPVTLNDVDPDGDVLVLTEPPVSQSDVTFSVVGDGTQVQAKVGRNVRGRVQFTYEISDGQQGHPPSEATVTLTLFGPDVDEPPTLIEGQTNTLRVAEGYEASVNVLPAWIDPEGDAVVLVGAESTGGDVGFRPDGTVDFADDPGGPGEKSVELTVRGGSRTSSGTLAVTIVDPEKAEPTTVADHVSGAVGSTILLTPLANDIDPLGGQLALSTVTNVSSRGAQVTRDGTRGTATFRADRPGAFYLTYEATASNGVPAPEQIIRVDVVAASSGNRPPIATRDVAALEADGSALVDVLVNDDDPDGDVLVVQGVRVPPELADVLTASLINKQFVRVELTGPLPSGAEPVVEYLLSDGRSDQVTGAVAVTVADGGQNRAPVAVEDLVTARAGTVIAIPVLDNDKDPDGDPLTVAQQDLYDVGPDRVVSRRQVPIVATGRVIRVLVPDDGTTQLQFGYGSRDPEQARGDSRVVININPDDPEANQKPQPRPIEDRTVTGQTIRVPVDTFGADPDGDPVVLTGVLEPPELGRILSVGSSWFEYEPLAAGNRTGTDTFRVQVSDQYGLSGVADVRIGVAPAASENQAPAALADEVWVKPGLTVQYPVLANDSDPDGDPLILADGDLFPSVGTEAALVDGFVEVETPEVPEGREVTQAVQYRVSDGLGRSASAVLTVRVSDEAPDYAPSTQDDVVPVADLRDTAAGDTVDVDVLENDGDIDGSREALVLESVDPDAATVVDRRLRIPVGTESRLIAYRVTDETDQVAFGFVYVAGTDRRPPMLDPETVPLEVVAGEVLEVDLTEVVVVRPGRTPRIGNAQLIAETNGEATPVGRAMLEFRAPSDYFGNASVTLPVIDGTSLQDPEGLEAQITIPITVLPSGNVPPVVRDTSITVLAGGDPVTLLLDRLASDPNEDDELDVAVDGQVRGLEAVVDDDAGTLTVSSAAGSPSDEVDLEVSVSDGDAPPVAARLRVTVVGIDDDGEPEQEEEQDEEVLPPMTLRELSVSDATAGEQVRVDVRDAILFDPLPGEPKRIVSATAAGSSSEPTVSGSTITLVPSAAGDVVVSYRLDDGSGEADRVVEGRVVVIVADVPGAPATPRAVEGGPDSVQLAWREPRDDGGSPVTGYLVRSDAGGQEWPCAQTQCTITDLDAGRTYRFSVVAVNDVGAGEPSPSSTPITPDTVPDKMATPVVDQDPTARDNQLRLTWTPPENDGSPLLGYRIESSPKVAIAQPGPGQTSVLVDTVKNGTGYRFSICALNDRGCGEPSELTDEETPFTSPSQMAAPSLTASNDDGRAGGYLTVDWAGLTSPQDGHDPVTTYTVQLFRDGGASPFTTVDVGGDVRQKSFDVENGHSYTAKVSATNRAGSGDPSPSSAATISWDKSQAVTGIAKASDCPDARCGRSTTSYVGRVRFTTPQDDGGYPVTKYRYRTQDGVEGVVAAPTSARGASTSVDVDFRTATANQTVRLTPVTNVQGTGEVDGTAASGGDFDPYALPPQPTITSQSGGYMSAQVRFGCDAGNGRPISGRDVSADSGAAVSACTVDWSGIEGGSRTCARVTVSNAAGRSVASDQACGTADARTLDVQFRSRAASASCSAPCYNVGYSVTGYLPGTYTAMWASQGFNGAGYAVCNSDGYQLPRDFTVGSNGRLTQIETWFISGSCKPGGGTVSVRADGVEDSRGLP